MNWTTQLDIKKKLLKRWESGKLIDHLVSKTLIFPYSITLKTPTSKEMLIKYSEVRIWVEAIKKGNLSGGKIEWKEINHRELGKNSLPSALIFPTAETLLMFIGKMGAYNQFVSLLSLLTTSLPELRDWAVKHPHVLIEKEGEIDKLISLTRWIFNNPNPAIYLRQLSLPGIDTKYIENNRGILSQWLDPILPAEAISKELRGVSNFEKRYGFLSKPDLVGFRIIDPSLRINGLSNLTVRSDEFAGLKLNCKNVFIIENDITALAFPALSDSIVIFGRGYDFSSLREALWLNKKNLFYWGDLDTHGLAILSQFRVLFPKTISILMDKKTLNENRDHWGSESKPVLRCPENLTSEEKKVFDSLSNIDVGRNIRLEQEFIDFGYVLDILSQLG